MCLLRDRVQVLSHGSQGLPGATASVPWVRLLWGLCALGVEIPQWYLQSVLDQVPGWLCRGSVQLPISGL